MPEYDITVELVGQDGNVFNLIGIVTKALRRNGVPAEKIKEFTDKCFSAGSYDEVLQIIMNTVKVE